MRRRIKAKLCLSSQGTCHVNTTGEVYTCLTYTAGLHQSSSLLFYPASSSAAHSLYCSMSLYVFMALFEALIDRLSVRLSCSELGAICLRSAENGLEIIEWDFGSHFLLLVFIKIFSLRGLGPPPLPSSQTGSCRHYLLFRRSEVATAAHSSPEQTLTV